MCLPYQRIIRRVFDDARIGAHVLRPETCDAVCTPVFAQVAGLQTMASNEPVNRNRKTVSAVAERRYGRTPLTRYRVNGAQMVGIIEDTTV